MMIARQSCFAMAVLALAACQRQGEDAPGAPSAAQPSARTDLVQANVVLANGRLILPAVPGHPGVVYFTLANPAAGDEVLTGVKISGAARADMYETIGTATRVLPSVTVPGGGSAGFMPGGRRVIVFGVGPALLRGDTARITLRFADGAKLSAPLKVQSVDDTGDADSAGGTADNFTAGIGM